ncbi:MAG: tRNA guanosine(15) transglycosylase TgtA [Candidatus Hodarchaeales archaeon]|jgi:7-cyano-7-deazaguanine tRNA-ribosyltransferase
MDSKFEIKFRDGLARTGEFPTSHGKVQTPTIMPVLDPLDPNQVSIKEISTQGAEIFITNAFILYKNQEARKKALIKGIHDFIGYNGPIMTDSGAFQLMSYGNIEMTNSIITKFEEEIGVDIGVFLDIPVAKGSYDAVKKAVEITVERADEHIRLRSPNLPHLWVGPIQGGEYLDLVKYSAIELGKRPFHVHALGSVVPLLEDYDYLTVAKIMLTAKQFLPFDRPVHLFGAGHPMLFSLAVYLGMDLFDSAAYILFAKAGRYLTTSGTIRLNELNFFPCACKYCVSTTPNEIKTWEKKEQIEFLALHNLAVSFAELRTIKQVLKEGRLWNLVLQRASAHPKLALAVQHLTSKGPIEYIERFSSISYPKARFYGHPWAFSDPYLVRYKQRLLDRYTILRDDLVLIPFGKKVKNSNNLQKIYVNPLFGLIPEEWVGLYPIVQHLTIEFPLNHDQNFIKKWLEKNKSFFNNIYSISDKLNFLALPKLSITDNNEKPIRDEEIIASYLRYHYNIDNPLDILPLKVKRSRKTNQIREFSKNFDRWGGIRSNDNYIIPSRPLALWLYEKLPKGKMQVTIDSEVSEFIQSGKSVFSRFVLEMDEDLRPGDEALIVSNENRLLGWGQVLLTSVEVSNFKRGVAVKTRKGIK